MEDLDSVWIKTKEYSCRWIYMDSVDNNTFLVSRALRMKNPTQPNMTWTWVGLGLN